MSKIDYSIFRGYKALLFVLFSIHYNNDRPTKTKRKIYAPNDTLKLIKIKVIKTLQLMNVLGCPGF